LKITLEIVCKRDARAFGIPARRWVIEAPRPGSSAAAGCARDYERPPESRETVVLWATIALMAQRLAGQAP
jgi:hypothetical protein